MAFAPRRLHTEQPDVLRNPQQAAPAVVNGSAAPSDIHPFAIISEVAPDSPAAAAGLQDSDQVCEVAAAGTTLLMATSTHRWPSSGGGPATVSALQVCKFGDSLPKGSEASATLRAIAAELQACISAQLLLLRS